MKIKTINIVLSVGAAILFLWLALRNINLTDLWTQISQVTFYWLPFFFIMLGVSHYLRAERWRLMLDDNSQKISRQTLFAGVMLGYMVNSIVPRLGEISRPVYVARKSTTTSVNMIGTVVAERIFDVVTMLFLTLIGAFWLVSDLGKLYTLLGIETWSNAYYLFIPVVITLLFFGIWLFYKIIFYVDTNIHFQNPVLSKIITSGKSFGEGLISLRNVKNWPLFLFLTLCIWLGYILMVYLPFYMMEMQIQFGLTLPDAVVLTVVSSVGVSIPTPAGIGSYHLLMQQSLWTLYDVPLTKAFTYATIVHAASIFSVFIIGPVSLWWDKTHTLTALSNSST